MLGNRTVPTQTVTTKGTSYAFRRFGDGPGLPLLCLQHFTGTLDNWDYAVTDPLAESREIILLDNAGVGRSSGAVPETIVAMARHAFAFLEAVGVMRCDVLGYSLGGMVAQQMALDRPEIFRRMVLAATAPRGGDDIMHIEKAGLSKYFQDPTLLGYARLQKIFFSASDSSQAAGAAFIARLAERKADKDAPSGPAIAKAQIAALREWEQIKGTRFAALAAIGQPTLVVNGIFDEMIPIVNSYRLAEHLPNAMLLAYPDAGHGAIFQFHRSFVQQAATFLDSSSSGWN